MKKKKKELEMLIKSYDDLYCAKFEVHNCVYCIEG